MSTCPTKDIHSLYLDDEMPQVYKKEYELHLESCEKCRNELAKLKAMKLLFKQDADSVSLDKSQLDQSYERLMVKMNYSKNSKKFKYTAEAKYTKDKINELIFEIDSFVILLYLNTGIFARISKI